MASLKSKLGIVAATLGAQAAGAAPRGGAALRAEASADAQRERYIREYEQAVRLMEGADALDGAALNRILAMGGTPRAGNRWDAGGLFGAGGMAGEESAPGMDNPSGVRGLQGAAPAQASAYDGFDIRRALFIDTETTGLSGGAGTLAFLVGLGWVEGDRFVVKQYLALDYPGEVDLLCAVARHMAEFDYAVTFNGKSFDMPLLESRFTLMRMRDRWRTLTPVDLLHPARRVWKLRLRDCSLSNLEDKVLGVPRHGDIAGADIPQRYFDFLKTGDMALLDDIVEHNRQDVVTMLALLLELNRMFEMGRDIPLVADRYSVGRSLLRGGLMQSAIECFDSVAAERDPPAIAGAAHMQLSMISKRSRDFESACDHWQAMIDMGQGHVTPYVELAKVHEHRTRDYARALALTERAIALAGGEGGGDLTLRLLQERRLRLLRKLKRQSQER